MIVLELIVLFSKCVQPSFIFNIQGVVCMCRTFLWYFVMLKYLYPLSVHYCFTVTKVILIQTSESFSSKSTASSKMFRHLKKRKVELLIIPFLEKKYKWWLTMFMIEVFLYTRSILNIIAKLYHLVHVILFTTS